MKMSIFKTIGTVASALIVLFTTSCDQPKSNTTGWAYNDPTNGGFYVSPNREQETGPGLILIEGGRFTMGRVEQDVLYDWNNIPRTVTVSSFYMDETEVRNVDYREYLYWLNRVFDENNMSVQTRGGLAGGSIYYRRALPDTLVWRDKLAYNEPYTIYYFRHPAYNDYPVVGVNWVQADQYCSWRTDRVNEVILIREGILDWDPKPTDQNYFNTNMYLNGDPNQTFGQGKSQQKYNPIGMGPRNVQIEDGILLPHYRLPTEAEWEYAALGLIGNTNNENIENRRLYPWDGHNIRTAEKANMGDLQTNIKRGRGDNMGVAGNLNDAGEITVPVFAYWPNDYGLYNMSGNVSEWTMDVYRPLSGEDVTDFRPYRGNVYMKDDIDPTTGFRKQADAVTETDIKNKFSGGTGGKLNTSIYDIDKNDPNYATIVQELEAYQETFRTPYPSIALSSPIDVNAPENVLRRNYRRSDNINYLDGDYASSINQNDWTKSVFNGSSSNNTVYDYGTSSLINNEAMVYKGGSWKDRVYWCVPGTRRYLDKYQSTDYIGFRCAMDRVGSPIGKGY